MTILMIACSRRAYAQMQKLARTWRQKERAIHIISKVKCSSLPDLSEKKTISECVSEELRAGADAVIFFCAAGIAVRTMAPLLVHKSVDPAVLVIDEMGKFCISLLSGHAGGANSLAERVGAMTGALPVITTATDLEQKFAVDDFARRNGLLVADWAMAKRISAAILEGEHVRICSDLVLEGDLPEELRETGDHEPQNSIRITCRQLESSETSAVLQLIPRTVVAGVGCRRGTPEEKIAAAIESCFREEHIRTESLAALASIDLKREEEGIVSYCRKRDLPFRTYSPEFLRGLCGDFAESSFVEETTGVSNVCERSAQAASGGRLICHKKVYDGVTVALAEKKRSVVF